LQKPPNALPGKSSLGIPLATHIHSVCSLQPVS
jgi:hypothetical protein